MLPVNARRQNSRQTSAVRGWNAGAHNQQRVVLVDIEQATVRCHPGIEQARRFQGGFDVRAVGLRSGWKKIAQRPKGCTRPVAARRMITGIRNRRRLMKAALQAAQLIDQLTFLCRC
jgi:hypothetical protein